MLFLRVAVKRFNPIRCQSLRMVSSALFVSGKQGTTQFAVFKPKLDLCWLNENQELLANIYLKRDSKVDIQSLLSDLEVYSSVTKNVSDMSLTLGDVQQIINDKKANNEDIKTQIAEFKKIKKEVQKMKTILWSIEEVSMLEYLLLQNCDKNSSLKEKVYYSILRNFDEDIVKVGHGLLCTQNNLAEFSNFSTSAAYLKNDLARLELKLCQFFTSKLLEYGFEITSNPDTVRSVIAEGCGLDFRNPDEIYSLKKFQDFGDRLSCNAMHLVGGASLPAFVSYFARNILQSSVLPVTMFCVGRHYRPESTCSASDKRDLVTLPQSQAVQIFSVSQSYEDMERQLKCILDVVVDVFSVFPNFKLTEETIYDCLPCNSRQFKIEMKGVEEVKVGSIDVQGKYFSDRMMMVTQEHNPLFTVSCNISINKLIAVLVELAQRPNGSVNVEQLIKMV